MLIKSPAQAAADSAAPQPDVLTAPVVRKVLAQSVVTRGTVTASQRTDIASTGSAKDVGRSVVTKVKIAPGGTLSPGQVLLEVSGRPMFILQGDLPAYRDLMPGMSGEDVTQLQRALSRIGYASSGDTVGVFGPGTEHAVTRYYRAIGYAPATSEVSQKPQTTDDAAQRTAKQGSGVPMSEVTFVRSSLARVDTVGAKVGGDANGTLLSVTSGTLMIDGSVASYEKDLIRAGQSVQVLSEVTGKQATGTVISVAKSPTKAHEGDSEQSGETYAVRIKPSKALSADFNGADVRLTIVAASSQDKVLAVPTSAISAGADGLTTVTVRADNQERRVAVRVGMTGDGYVQITPEGSDHIAQGDQVVVGVQAPVTAGQS
ncbi:peptidoglycan-binding protein [Streptomyces beijiangensis]|uniref:Peptidoglycan-binding protein n=1 Tax=Streptomyces beijiangensis TaxID=163361 RepID=A0A939F2T8_9ACTN|nr:peptidoglycan-binding protein [Streptomyces beijiangensis]MBO0511087.1 peptidoglycan-binding protein [Streptomyces beijiangensis]